MPKTLLSSSGHIACELLLTTVNAKRYLGSTNILDRVAQPPAHAERTHLGNRRDRSRIGSEPIAASGYTTDGYGVYPIRTSIGRHFQRQPRIAGHTSLIQ